MKSLRAKVAELLGKLRALIAGPPELKPIPIRSVREVERWHNEGGH